MRYVIERVLLITAEIVGGTPRDLAVYLKADYEKWGVVVKAAGLRQ